MGRKNKLKRFAEMRNFQNVYENFDYEDPQLFKNATEQVDLRGKWSKKHFDNEHPITLELACGRGEYTTGLAERYPDRNFIGVDVKGARMWKGAKRALNDGLDNAAFLRTRIEVIDRFFAPGEVNAIWITFPDPFLKDSKANRRLTSDVFLDIYKRILQPGSLINLKTDSRPLYDFTLETLETRSDYALQIANPDIYAGILPVEELELKTYYEKKHLEAGKKITFIQFRLNG